MKKYYFTTSDDFWGRETPVCMTREEMEENCRFLSQESGWLSYSELMELFHEATPDDLEQYGTTDGEI